MAERIRALWQRLLADIHRNPGLWIGVGISAVILVVAYLAYRKQQNSQQGQVPANGYGYPDYGSATGGSSGGLFGGGYNPGPPNLNFGPNPGSSTPPVTPPVAVPPVPPFSSNPPPVPTPSNPSNPLQFGPQLGHKVNDRGGGSTHHTFIPTTHRPRRVPDRGRVPHTQNPLADSESAHSGLIPAHHSQGYHVPIPTTQRPRTVTGKGRVA